MFRPVMTCLHTCSLLALMIITFNPMTAFAQNTAFTYQGRLSDGANPADGIYDMQFKLFDMAVVGTGTQQGATITNPGVQVNNGAFSVLLDFGASVYDGSARFL